ncbi:MAG TPA: hypothetical protein VHA56_06370 [Mucilaginibacter sp.]|nr:hypothetical protein [Mucilaginibacter sp.]
MAQSTSTPAIDLDGNWEYTCILSDEDNSFPKESTAETTPPAFSHGGTISFKHLDDKIKVSGQREWRKTKDNTPIDSPAKPIQWSGEFTTGSKGKTAVYKFSIKDDNAKYKGLQGTTSIIIEHDPSNPGVRQGWFHYIPSIDFMSGLSEQIEGDKVDAGKLHTWLCVYGKITLKKK